jgi:hypothetical protein
MNEPQTVPEFFALSPWHNPPAVETILTLLWPLIDACEEQVWRAHWHEEMEVCPCIYCEHVAGLLYNIRQSEAALDCAVRHFPALLRRQAERAREAGDEERAREHEQRAADKERNAEAVPTPQATEWAPAVVLLQALKAKAEGRAGNPFYAR